MNSATYVFGVRCLNNVNRFLVWHGEDVYGHRGVEAQLQLQHRLSDMIHVPLQSVSKVFVKLHRRRLSRRLDSRRRLSYGKYLEEATHMNLTRVHMCGEAAVPGAMDAFHYDIRALLRAQSSVKATATNKHKANKVADQTRIGTDSSTTTASGYRSNTATSSYWLLLCSFMLALIWCRRRNPADPHNEVLKRSGFSWPFVAIILYIFAVYLYNT